MIYELVPELVRNHSEISQHNDQNLVDFPEAFQGQDQFRMLEMLYRRIKRIFVPLP